MTCESLADVLPGLATGEVDVGRRIRSHVAACLRCQAEMARYRRMRRSLLTLRDEPVKPASMLPTPVLTAMVLDRLDALPDAERSARSPLQLACVGGLSVATVAGAGMLVWLTRRRLTPAG